jgi:predicted permease
MSGLLRDLQSVLRQMRQAPGFVIAATLTLALGIGANTAIFSVISGFMRPLPVPDPDRIVILASSTEGDETGLRFRFSFPALQDYRARATSFSDVFGHDIRIAGLGSHGKVTPFVHNTVTGNFFTALKLEPVAGRLFAPGEGETPGGEAVIVLGHAYWLRHFGGDLSVIGTVVRLDGSPARIVGVAPEGFAGLTEGTVLDGYVTLASARRIDFKPNQMFVDRSSRRLTMAARLKPGVSVAEAQAEVDVVAAQLVEDYRPEENGTTTRVIPEQLARPLPWPVLASLLPLIRFFLWVLSSLVLLIACMNVANILLVRVTVREREMAVRASLGAGRGQLVRLLLIESLLLATTGTAMGLALGKVLSEMFVNSVNIGTDIPFRLNAAFDWRVFAYSAVAALATGIIVGALPARRVARTNVAGLLHDGGRSGTASKRRQRIRQSLVVAQVAGSLVLLIVAGLFVRNLQQAQRVDLGFHPEAIMTARLDTMNLGFDEARSVAFYEELHRRLKAMPGVESASLSFSIPLGWILGGYLAAAEDAPPSDVPLPAIGCNSVSPEYFDTLGIPIVHGRGFTDQDVKGSTRVAVINEVLAARFWPNEDPIGKRISVPSVPGEPWEVVGIAKTGKYFAIFESPLPHFYLPVAQNPAFLRHVTIRSSMPLPEVRARLEREIAALEPELPIADLKPLSDLISGNIGFVLFRVGAWQATSMGLLGLALAVIGVYGVVSYQTQQRSREIGIRVALGAVPRDVLRLVLKQGVTMVLTGAAIGFAITLVVTTALGRMLVLVSTTDPIAFGGVTAVLVIAAMVACYIPAWRATKVEPVTVLRQE